MQRHDIPTATYREFDSTNYDKRALLSSISLPMAQADGLAAASVLICRNHIEAGRVLNCCCKHSKFGDRQEMVWKSSRGH